ncbi:MAG: hypothetical protein AB7S71_15225 [Dongiaceae bacterium]
MRTTLTLDDDVAALLERVRKARKTGLKETVNDALRQGLRQMAAPPPKRKPYVTPSWDLGKCLVDNLDNISEVLAYAEGEDYR